MKEEHLDTYHNELMSRGLIDDALCLGYRFYEQITELKVDDIVYFSPNFKFPMSKDTWTYEDALKYSDPNYISLFVEYKISRICNKSYYRIYAIPIKDAQNNPIINGQEIDINCFNSPIELSDEPDNLYGCGDIFVVSLSDDWFQ